MMLIAPLISDVAQNTKWNIKWMFHYTHINSINDLHNPIMFLFYCENEMHVMLSSYRAPVH